MKRAGSTSSQKNIRSIPVDDSDDNSIGHRSLGGTSLNANKNKLNRHGVS